MTLPAKTAPAPDIMERVIIMGDLKRLTPQERVQYYNETCKSVGLNPLTRPFEYIELQGKLTLYARRDAADQLRKINGISIEIVSQDIHDGLYSVHVRAKDRDGRTDEDLGVVAFPDNMRGDVRANTILKAITKGKRRVTLSLSGLGWLDETEVEDIPGARPPPEIKTVMRPAELSTGERIDRETGEIIEPAAKSAAVLGTAEAAPPEDTPEDGAATLSIEDMAREAASRGVEPIRKFWKACTKEDQARINAIKPEIDAILAKAEEAISGGPY